MCKFNTSEIGQINNKKPIFISSLYRSSSTFLAAVLSCDPKYFTMSSAVKFLKKHMRMDHDVKNLEKNAKLSDGVFKIEADVEESGKVSDEQIKSAQKLTDQVYATVEKMGHKKTEVSYMDLHMDAIKNPEKAGSMK